jgi:hypothetical protein
MPTVRASLPERYALTMVWAILGNGLLFVLSTFLLIGIIQGSAPWYITTAILLAEALSIIGGVYLAVIYRHDRELMRKPQEYRGELA